MGAGMKFAQWVRERAFTAGTINPEAPLDDLEPLRALIGGARVVAIGESAHHVREFYLLRHRLLRFLVERCGFSVYAFESPYVESESLDGWVCGGPGDLAALTGTPDMSLTACQDMHDALTWMREHNTTAERPVRFAGTLAGNGGVPELRRLRTCLQRTDPDAIPLLDRALTAAGSFYDDDPFRTIARYQALDQSVRDALTADLSRLLARLESMRAGRASVDDAMTYLRGAWLIDHLYRDVSGCGLSVGTTSLDAFVAESVLRRLDHEPDARIVLALHNVHIRTAEVEHDGPTGLFPAGYHLRKVLGDDYVAIAATGNHGHVVSGDFDADRPSGMRLLERALPAPEPGSVEAAFDGTAALTVADLREADVEDADTFCKFRSQDEFLKTPVFEAFDAVAYLPRLRTTDGFHAT
ncbi:erythromycin esterase family protein [Streptomyces iconiensis]|uniref:Erythromycin esterase family protein n=1 Tax=Streptomyces iconiensis TaxID=1384038 RepID=A0ABT7A3J0_9ACTN|nr:erythromycin esterase family protein [Streptomyces iconiensis]MDJ1135908.1 erythromycin esterase family protein [Streptomyces iconiensis]